MMQQPAKPVSRGRYASIPGRRVNFQVQSCTVGTGRCPTATNLRLISSGSPNGPVDESTSTFKPSRSSSSRTQRELPNGVEIKRVSAALEFLDVNNVSAAIDGKDFEDKISTQRSSPARRKPRPASAMLIEDRLVFTDVEMFSSTVTNCWTF